MDPAEGSFEEKLFSLIETLVCLFGEWKRWDVGWEYKKAA